MNMKNGSMNGTGSTGSSSSSSSCSFSIIQRLPLPTSQLHAVITTAGTTNPNTTHISGNNNTLPQPHTHHHSSSSNVNNDHSDRKLMDDRSRNTTRKRCGRCVSVRCCIHCIFGRCLRRGNLFLTTRTILYFSPCFLLLLLLCIYTIQRMLSYYSQKIVWEHPPYHFLTRTCTPPIYYTYSDHYHHYRNTHSITTTANVKPKICITTLTDETNKSFLNRILGWRNFDGIMALTWENKYRYAQQHQYYIYDESHVVNHTRGPSWFKIIAVLRLLQVEQCDWVFWMDADMVIMNSTIKLEDIIPYYSDNDAHDTSHKDSMDSTSNTFTARQPNYDLLLSLDLRGSTTNSNSAGTTQLIRNGTQQPPYYSTSNTGIYNAGAWMIRNSAWSIQFLNTWWNMNSYVQPIGHSFSGDNHALKDLLREFSSTDFNDHCLVPPRCTFNSFAKFVHGSMPESSREQLLSERQYNEAYYHQTDFVAHVAGVDNKRDTIQMLLDLAQ